MKLLKSLFGASPTRRITLHNPLVVQSPRIGFLNLLGSSAELNLQEDRETLAPLFSRAQPRDGIVPGCDVLLIYGRLEEDGRFADYPAGLREIIRSSTASIVVVASENDGRSYVAAGKDTGFGRANLIMTLQRKEAALANFLSRLFELMYKGKTMPVAWVELAPQAPDAIDANAPDTIFAAEIGHIIFERA